MPPSRQQAAVVAVIAMAAATGHAQPRVKLEVSGNCPSFDQVRDAIAEWVHVVDRNTDAEWTIAVVVGRRSSRLEIRTKQASVVRGIASDDCEAMAEAFAVMVHGHLVELQLLPEPATVPEDTRHVPTRTPASPDPHPRMTLCARGATDKACWRMTPWRPASVMTSSSEPSCWRSNETRKS